MNDSDGTSMSAHLMEAERTWRMTSHIMNRSLMKQLLVLTLLTDNYHDKEEENFCLRAPQQLSVEARFITAHS